MKWLNLFILIVIVSAGCSKKEEPPPPPPVKSDKLPELSQNTIYLTNRTEPLRKKDTRHVEVPDPFTAMKAEEEEFFAPTVD